jgi:hypothetical protein
MGGGSMPYEFSSKAKPILRKDGLLFFADSIFL